MYVLSARVGYLGSTLARSGERYLVGLQPTEAGCHNMSKSIIPPAIQSQAETIVSEFNRSRFPKPERGYKARFRGRFLYLDRCDLGEPFQICRLEYQGELENWDFAIYRHSKERYDPDEWFFPGFDFVDGTVKGAMEAGLQAYPMTQDTLEERVLRGLFRKLFKG